MSNLVFPYSRLPGVKINVKRRPMFKTQVQESISGKELRASWWTYPRYKYTLSFEGLRAANAYQEFQTLVGFIGRHLGQFDSFLFQDPEDNAVTAHPFARGNGITAAFQLQRSLVPAASLPADVSKTFWPNYGDGYEPIFDLNGAPTIYRTDWQGNQLMYQTARTNVCIQSQNYSTSWSINAATRTPNVGTAPDGTATMTRLVESATAAVHAVYLGQPSVNNGDWVTASVHVSQFSNRSASVTLYGAAFPGGSASIQFNPTSGLIEFAYNAAGCTYGVIPLSGGTYRIWLRRQAAATGTFTIEHDLAQPGVNNAAYNYTGDGASGVNLWGTMAEINSPSTTGPTAYIPTTTAAVTVTDYSLTGSVVTLASTTNPVAAQSLGTGTGSTATFAVTTPNGATPTVLNVWRTDWQGRQRMYSTSRTNTWLQSVALGTAPNAVSGATVSGTAGTAPDGTNTAWKLAETAVTAQHFLYQSITYAAGNRTQTFFLKSAERTWAIVQVANGTAGAYINLATGTVGTIQGAASISATLRADGWVKVTVAATVGAGATLARVGTATGDGVESYLGVAGSGILIWHPQNEVGGAGTSDIPTTTVAVTVTDWSQVASNVVFASNPLAGALIEADYTYVGGLAVGNVLSWTGGYYRRARLASDDSDFERVVVQWWKNETLELISTK